MKLKNIKKIFYLVSTIPKYIKLLWNLLKDKRVPAYLKIFALGAISYFIVPVDTFPDFLPAWGLIDDVTVILLVIERFISFCPRDVIEEHMQNMEIGISDFDRDLNSVKNLVASTYHKIKRNLAEIINTYKNKF